MSLKAFHIIFIGAAVVLCLATGIWAIGEYRLGQASVGMMAFAAGSFGLALGLLVYGRYVLRKLKHISYL